VDFTFSPSDEEFRGVIRDWLDRHLVGEFASLGTGNDLGGPDELAVRKAWEKKLAAGRWVGLAWPERFGGRGATLSEQLIFNEEYARAGGPNRCGFFGEQLLGPTLMEFGTEEQKARLLSPILHADEYWCQGFSEPDAGSDLAAVKTTAMRDGDGWRIHGQKVWTSLGHIADWIFVLCRTDPDSAGGRHRGLTFLLCPLDQPGIEMRPIRQLTGTVEFNEVFFDGARTGADMVVGEVNGGWRVVMATLGFERGTAFLGQQLRFAREFDDLVGLARERGAAHDPKVRQSLAGLYAGLQIMRWTGLRTVSQMLRGDELGPEASIGKLHWSRWHQQLGSVAMGLAGAEAAAGVTHRMDDFRYSFLFSRAHTIYAGSSEIQRNIIGERVLGLPKDV
jgi:alkylation response protein AidB-like acyl-CoA dehydrogenase